MKPTLSLGLASLLGTTTSSVNTWRLQCGTPQPRTLFDRALTPVQSAVSNFLHVTYTKPGGQQCPTKLDTDTLQLATWPTYANDTHIHLVGYAYALPECRIKDQFRYQVLADLLHLAGGNLDYYDKLRWADTPLDRACLVQQTYRHRHVARHHFELEDTPLDKAMQKNDETLRNASLSCEDRPSKPYGLPLLMPQDYLSWSVTGASLELTTTSLELTTTVHTIHALDISTNRHGHFEGFVRKFKPSRGSQPITERATMQQTYLELCENVSENESVYKAIPSTFNVISVPPRGLTVVSDVDDVLRITESWNPKRMILNTFGREFTPWLSMDRTFRKWHDADPSIHFHYVSDAPEMSYNNYVSGIEMYFPLGSYDFRAMDFSSAAQTFRPRFQSISRLIQSFPERHFLLVGDDATPGLVAAYAQLHKTFPSQVMCIAIRHVSGTEDSNWISSNIRPLRKAPHVTFQTPTQLGRLEIVNGSCALPGPSPRHRPGYSLWGRLAKWPVSLARAFMWFEQCIITGLALGKPNSLCPFDLRDGTFFEDGFYLSPLEEEEAPSGERQA